MNDAEASSAAEAALARRTIGNRIEFSNLTVAAPTCGSYCWWEYEEDKSQPAKMESQAENADC